jgi:hypothetical protein
MVLSFAPLPRESRRVTGQTPAASPHPPERTMNSLSTTLRLRPQTPWISALAGCGLAVGLLAFGAWCWAADEAPAAEDKNILVESVKFERPVDFRDDVLPIMKAKCLACHTGAGAEGGVVLDNGTAMVDFGIVIPRQVEKSSLMTSAAHQKKPFMPPAKNKKNATNMTPRELGVLKLWIEQGAKDSLREGVLAQASAVGPFVAADLEERRGGSPATKVVYELLSADRAIAEVVDFYIGAKLKEAAVTPAPQADDATLIRRLTLDLCGRIPTLAETQAYVESKESDKREKLVDHLMASPGFLRQQETARIPYQGARGQPALGPDLPRAGRRRRV